MFLRATWWKCLTPRGWWTPYAHNLCLRRLQTYCPKDLKERMPMKRSNQKGVALLITLILVMVLSVLAASMMFLAQSETWSSQNYRLMTQARYGAEAGLHAAANYITE